jgi:hypothetical protein
MAVVKFTAVALSAGNRDVFIRAAWNGRISRQEVSK